MSTDFPSLVRDLVGRLRDVEIRWDCPYCHPDEACGPQDATGHTPDCLYHVVDQIEALLAEEAPGTVAKKRKAATFLLLGRCCEGCAYGEHVGIVCQQGLGHVQATNVCELWEEDA